MFLVNGTELLFELGQIQEIVGIGEENHPARRASPTPGCGPFRVRLERGEVDAHSPAWPPCRRHPKASSNKNLGRPLLALLKIDTRSLGRPIIAPTCVIKQYISRIVRKIALALSFHVASDIHKCTRKLRTCMCACVSRPSERFTITSILLFQSLFFLSLSLWLPHPRSL